METHPLPWLVLHLLDTGPASVPDLVDVTRESDRAIGNALNLLRNPFAWPVLNEDRRFRLEWRQHPRGVLVPCSPLPSAFLGCSGPGYQDHSRFGQAGPLSSGNRDHPGSGKGDHVRSGNRDQSPW